MMTGRFIALGWLCLPLANPQDSSGPALSVGGEGQTSPPGVDGKIADQILPKPLVPVSVQIDGVSVTPLYAAAAGGAVAGALQVNIQIPASITPGNHVPIQIQIGTASSKPNVTIAVN